MVRSSLFSYRWIGGSLDRLTSGGHVRLSGTNRLCRRGCWGAL